MSRNPITSLADVDISAIIDEEKLIQAIQAHDTILLPILDDINQQDIAIINHIITLCQYHNVQIFCYGRDSAISEMLPEDIWCNLLDDDMLDTFVSKVGVGADVRRLFEVMLDPADDGVVGERQRNLIKHFLYWKTKYRRMLVLTEYIPFFFNSNQTKKVWAYMLD